MNKIKESLPAMAVIAILLAAWWLIVAETHSVIFPTPWQVVTGTAELIRDGTLFMHIGASLMRVGIGFSLDRKSTRLNSSHLRRSRMPSSA